MNQSDFLPASRPLLSDLKSCDEWLARAYLSDPRQACHEFTLLLEQLEEAPPRHLAYLDILERLRKPLAAAQEELAKKFLARALPLGHVENAAFEQSYDLWRAVMRGYRRLFRAALKDNHPELAGRTPLLCQRSLEATGELLATFWQARREIDPDLWPLLHELYASAETRGFANLNLASAGARAAGTNSHIAVVKSCTSTYLRPLLLHLAQPYGLSGRDFHLARRWAYRWSHKPRLLQSRTRGGAHYIDLAGSEGPRWSADADGAADGAAGATLRYIDMSELARSLRGRQRLLAGGAMPAELGLGADCTQATCGELLSQLVRSWLDAPKPRQFPRRQQMAPTELVAGFTAIHFAISGRPFDDGHAALKQWHYTRRDAEHIHIFQHAPALADKAAALNQAAPLLEQWDTLDESATGFRMRRDGPGARLQHRQLVALRPQGAKRMILAEVRWLLSGHDNSLAIGARALPGIARACMVRVKPDGPGQKEAFSQAFLLPVAPGLAPSLVLPTGWYQNGREIELRLEDESFVVSLFGLLGRGADYDRANFTARS
jgi:hypothetical protein